MPIRMVEEVFGLAVQVISDPLTGTGLRPLSGRNTPTSRTETDPSRPRWVALTEPAKRWTCAEARA